jgi:hypothetical protein
LSTLLLERGLASAGDTPPWYAVARDEEGERDLTSTEEGLLMAALEQRVPDVTVRPPSE